MALIARTATEVGDIVTIIQQKILITNQFDGAAPELAGEEFVPYYNEEDGLIVMAQHDDDTKDAGDAGGLFEFDTIGPCALEYVTADLGEAVAWVLSIITTSGTVPLAAATSRYIARTEVDRIYLLPGDKLEFVTTGSTKAMWLRLGLTLAQGTH